jgi:hypothetical protein
MKNNFKEKEFLIKTDFEEICKNFHSKEKETSNNFNLIWVFKKRK